MEYVRSVYNIDVEKEGIRYLVNTVSGSIVEILKNEHEDIKKY